MVSKDNKKIDTFRWSQRSSFEKRTKFWDKKQSQHINQKNGYNDFLMKLKKISGILNSKIKVKNLEKNLVIKKLKIDIVISSISPDFFIIINLVN